MSDQPKHSAEPWQPATRAQLHLGRVSLFPDALAGMASPAATIAALRGCAEALRRFVVTTSDNQCATLPDGQRCRFVVCAVCDARAALAALSAANRTEGQP